AVAWATVSGWEVCVASATHSAHPSASRATTWTSSTGRARRMAAAEVSGVASGRETVTSSIASTVTGGSGSSGGTRPSWHPRHGPRRRSRRGGWGAAATTSLWEPAPVSDDLSRATVTLDDVRAAAERIAGAVERTPSARSRTLSEVLGVDVVVKFENLQFIAAFKERG